MAVTNFGIPKRKSDDDWEVNGVGKMQFLSEVGLMVSSESDVLEKSTLNNEGLASAERLRRRRRRATNRSTFVRRTLPASMHHARANENASRDVVTVGEN